MTYIGDRSEAEEIAARLNAEQPDGPPSRGGPIDLAVRRQLLDRNVAHATQARRRRATRAAARTWTAPELAAFLAAARTQRLYPHQSTQRRPRRRYRASARAMATTPPLR